VLGGLSRTILCLDTNKQSINKRLSRLCLQFNFFTGPVPSDLGSLSKTLTTLNLSHNALQGKVPENISDLTRLQVQEKKEMTMK
jgi:hypothetical protein